MTALDATPSGLDLLAVRLGAALQRWGRARAVRRALPATHVDPRALQQARLEAAATRARLDATLMRIR